MIDGALDVAQSFVYFGEIFVDAIGYVGDVFRDREEVVDLASVGVDGVLQVFNLRS